MITQQIDLNLIPDSAPVIVHVDQYDIGAGRLVMALYEGDEPYTPTAATVQIQGTKPDGHAFLYDAVVNGNVVTSDLKEQMTTCAGDVRTQVVVRENSGRTGSFAFVLRVQRSALPADSDMSESDLSAIEELIETAAGIVEDATDAAQDAEAWAQGTRGGDPVGPTDPTYEHNAAYWAAYAEQYAEGALHYKGSIAFANIPITGMVEGDMYNITDDFVTDSRFAEGAGVHAKAGTNIAYDLNDKWDLFAMPQIPTMTASEQGIGRPDGMTADVTQGVFRAKGVAIYSTVNPIGTEYGADWLKYGDTVITPSTIQLYLVYIAGKPTLWTWDLTEQEYVKVSADGGGSASDLDDLGDVDISNPQDGEALIYDAATGKWVNVNITPANVGAVATSSVKTSYQSSPSSGQIYDAAYINNLAGCEAVQITTSGWSSGTTSVAGKSCYYKTLTLTNAVYGIPEIKLKPANGTPTAAEESLFNCLDYYGVDSASPNTLKLYAVTKPTSSFYIWVIRNGGRV